MDQVSSNIFEIEKEETKIQEEKATEEVFEYAVLLNNEEEVFFTGAEPKYGIWSYNDKTDIVDENGKSITFKTEEEANAYVEVLRKNKDIAYESNEKKELEAAQDGFIEKKSVSELEIGDCVSVDGKNWRITSTDSFMMSFENLDPSDITPNFSLIGHAHERLSEHDWKHIPEPNTELKTRFHLPNRKLMSLKMHYLKKMKHGKKSINFGMMLLVLFYY